MLFNRPRFLAVSFLLVALGATIAFPTVLSSPVSAQAQGCTLTVTSITGNTGNFVVTGSGTTQLNVSACAACTQGLCSVTVGSSNNASVTIAPFANGTVNPVGVTASTVDPGAASFTIVAMDCFSHSITVTVTVECPQDPPGPVGCTYTQGWYKNHFGSWTTPGITLGNRLYTEAELESILSAKTKNNGLSKLANQLISAKLNIQNGASAPASVQADIAAADALIGDLVVSPVGNGFLSEASTITLVNNLSLYNEGLAVGGPPHCQ
jgi:hypothetical protein